MTYAKILLFVSLLVCASAQAEDTVESLFADALLCKTPAVDGQDPATQAKLKKLHVQYQPSGSQQESIDQQFVFEKPVRIEGVLVSGVAYAGDDSVTFLADASGDPDAFAKRLGMQKTTQTVEKTLRIQYYKYAQPPTQDNPTPEVIVIQNADGKGHFSFGCWITSVDYPAF